jgi:hypothetical protein
VALRVRGTGPPPVTVIVPVYNGEATLGRTLDSLVGQTFRHWRAVVVDNGSTDGSRAIAEAAAARDPRIRVIFEARNVGVGGARNLGLAATDSPWVLFLDADDTLTPDGLARLAAGARAGVDVVVGHCPLVDGDGKVWMDYRYDLSDPWALLSVQSAIPIHAALSRRDMMTAVGGFDPGLGGHEDWDLWARVARSGAVFRQVRARVGLYWTRPGSLSKSYRTMAESALTVVRRIHGPDPRTPQAPAALAQGLPASMYDRHALPSVVWPAAGEVALGGDAAWIDAIDRPRVDRLDDTEVRIVAHAIRGAVVVATMTPADRLAELWPGLARPMADLLARLFPGEAMAMTRVFVLLLVKDGMGVRLGSAPADEAPEVTQLALDLGAPAPATAATAGRGLAVQLRFRGASLGVAFARPGPGGAAPDPSELAQSAFAALSMRHIARVLRPWRDLRFWIALAAEAPKGGGKRALFTRAAARVALAGLGR